MSSTKPMPTPLLNTYLQMGCNEQLLKQAWINCKGVEAALLDEYQFLQENNNNIALQHTEKITSLTGNMDEEKQLNEAIIASAKDAQKCKIILEPLNPEQRIRKDGIPVGLKNLGNTCYINPLLQVYYYNTEFASAILNFQQPSDEELKAALQKNISDEPQNQQGQSLEFLLKRTKASVNLVSSLQDLYLHFTGSDKKYIDPTSVIQNIVDDQGNQFQIGDQQDIGEFNLTFLARIDEGLQHSKSALGQNSMEIESLKRKISGTNQKMSDASVVGSNFFGRLNVEMKYQLGEEQFMKTEDESFNIIFLDIKYKELYQALDEYVVNYIDEYKNDRGDVVPAQKNNWIGNAPNTLFFQLQRVVFDKKNQRLQKLNDPFQIEKEIYLERYTHQRKQDYLTIRAKVYDLVKQKLGLEEQLHQLQVYQGVSSTQVGLLPLLTGTISFLQENSQNKQETSSFFGNNAENAIAIKVIQGYAEMVKVKIEQLENQIKSLSNCIRQSYNSFNNDKYHLQAILIHDGLAESGHYYTFIQDIQVKKWWRYNDIQVSEETEENVFKEAIGGWGNASAYSLIYVKESVSLPPSYLKDTPLHLFLTSQSHSSLSASQVRNIDYYSQIIPEDMLNKLCESNLKFQEEIEDYKTNNSVRNIIELYQQRFEQNNECSRKAEEARKKVKGSPPPFIQFCVYLKLHQGNEKGGYEEIIKWLILDSCVREQYKGEQKLNSLTNKKLESKLKSQISSLGEFKAPKSLVMSHGNLDIIEIKNSEFLRQLTNAETTIYAMQSALKFDWISSLSSLDYLTDLNKFLDSQNQTAFKDDYFFKIQRDTKLIILITFLHYCEIKIQLPSTNPEEVLNLLKVFVAFYKKQFKMDQKAQLTFASWIADIIPLSKDQSFQNQLSAINQEYMNGGSQKRFFEVETQINKLPQELVERHDKLVGEGDMYYWNVNKKEDCLFNELISNFEKVKTNFSQYIAFTQKMRTSQIPLFKTDRQFNNSPSTFHLN